MIINDLAALGLSRATLGPHIHARLVIKIAFKASSAYASLYLNCNTTPQLQFHIPRTPPTSPNLYRAHVFSSHRLRK